MKKKKQVRREEGRKEKETNKKERERVRYNTMHTAGWTSFTNLTTPLYSTPFDEDEDEICNDEHMYAPSKNGTRDRLRLRLRLRYDTIR